MNTVVEIDKAGRIVIPKRFRDALGLKAGTRLRLDQSGETLTLDCDAPEARLEFRDGLPLIVGSGPADFDIPTLIRQGYEERERRILEGSGLV